MAESPSLSITKCPHLCQRRDRTGDYPVLPIKAITRMGRQACGVSLTMTPVLGDLLSRRSDYALPTWVGCDLGQEA